MNRGATDRQRSDVRRAFRSKTHRDLFDYACRAGWLWRVGGGGHVTMYAPAPSKDILHLSTTAYDGGPRGTAKLAAILKRNGVDIP